MLLAIILSAIAAGMWAAGTAMALHTRRGQRFGRQAGRLPMSTRLLWCCGPILLALAANVYYGQPRDPPRLATVALVALVLLAATMIVPILVHNARLSQAR
jgi:hypothetical protein